jgi:hypothetical protein
MGKARPISAPAFGADGKIAAAIAVGVPTERVNSRIEELRPILGNVAFRASDREWNEHTQSGGFAVRVAATAAGPQARGNDLAHA